PGLEGAGRGREIGGGGWAGEIDVAGRIHRDRSALVASAPAEEGGVDERRGAAQRRVHLRQEGVLSAAERGPESAGGGREIGGGGSAGEIDVAGRIHRDGIGVVALAPAEEGAEGKLGV